MKNLYSGNCNNCGKFVDIGKGRHRTLPKQTQDFLGLRCKFCSTTTIKNKALIIKLNDTKSTK